MDSWMTCRSLMNDLQREMSEQHLEQAREREREREERERERQALKQLWNKEKSQYSAVASPWVKQKLRQLIKRKKKQKFSTISSVPSGFRKLAPILDLNFQRHQQNSATSESYREKQIWRADSCSRSPVSDHSSASGQSESGSLAWDYSAKLSHMSKKTLNPASMEKNHTVTPPYVIISPEQETEEVFHSAEQPFFFQSNVPVGSQVPLMVSEHRSLFPKPHAKFHTYSSQWPERRWCIQEPRGHQLSPEHQNQAPEEWRDKAHLMLSEHRPLTKARSQPLVQTYSSRCPERYWCREELFPGQQDQATKEWIENAHLMDSEHRPLTKTWSLPYRTQCLERWWSRQEPRGQQLPPGQQEQAMEEWIKKDTWRENRRVRFEDDERLKTTAEVNNSPEKLFSEGNNQSSSKQDETTSYTPFRSPLQRRPARRVHPVSRTLSSPMFFLPGNTEPPTVSTDNCRTGLVCDCSCGDSRPHPEHATNVWSRLQECGLSNHCKWIPGRKAVIDEIQSVLGNHIFPYGTNPLGRLNLAAIRMAVGSVMELALRVIQGELRNGFAIIKPHEHVASQSESVRFLSSVAIAAKLLQERLHDKRILIIDWDVHHDNLAQNIFYTNPNVLYISLHRYDVKHNPGSGGPEEVGSGRGMGFNVNVTWTGGLDYPVGDAEYLAAFRTVVFPIVQEFSPDVILVSSEFNAVDSHPTSLGRHTVSPKCFGLLTQILMDLAGGRVVLVLEGGHDLMAICDASEACVNALLKHKVAYLSKDALTKKPCENAVQSLEEVLHIQRKYWRSVSAPVHTVSQSWLQAERRYSTDSDAALAMASLSMTGPNRSSRLEAEVQFWRCVQNEPMEHDENDIST